MGKIKIKIKDLDLYYGDFHALKNINLDIEANKITAFIGPSGCGKSTLLKSLNRMNDLVEGCRIEGEVTLDGEDFSQYGCESFEKTCRNGISEAESVSNEYL